MTPEQFRDARKSLGLTQTQLADRWGKTRRTIGRWETGEIPIDRMAVDCITLMMGGWLKNPPKDGSTVLTWHPEFGVLLSYYDDATADWWAIKLTGTEARTWFSPYMDGTEEVDAEDWMPIPSPPMDRNT